MKNTLIILLAVLLGSCADGLVAQVEPIQKYESDGYHTTQEYDQSITAQLPYEGCCAIIINHKAKTVNYLSELGTDIEPYSSLEEMDEIINSMQEHCYHEHYTEY
jgi:PBP1b-binding outer membrane lipoprotein LpoB